MIRRVLVVAAVLVAAAAAIAATLTAWAALPNLIFTTDDLDDQEDS